jgi:hypothetical protein
MFDLKEYVTEHHILVFPNKREMLERGHSLNSNI